MSNKQNDIFHDYMLDNLQGIKSRFCIEGRHWVDDTKVMVGDNCEDHDKDFEKR